jgi:ribose transport system substrate-binding protein
MPIRGPTGLAPLSVAAAISILVTAGCPGRGASRDGQTAAAADAGAARRRQLRIAMIAKSATNPSFLAARTGAEAAAREASAKLGVDVTVDWMTPPQEDGRAQAQRISQAASEHADAVLLSCSDARAVTPAIDDAVARGVAVMTFDSDCPESRRFAYAGVDDFKAGEAIMAELARVVAPGAKVAVLAGNPEAPNLRSRLEGVMHEAARHPHLKMVGPIFHPETPEEASAAVLRAQAANPGIEGWAMIGGWALYTRTLLTELDRPRPRGPSGGTWPKVKIVSINALPPQLPYVERGLAPVLLAQPTYVWGAVGVKTIVDKLVLGKPVPARIPLELIRVTAATMGAWARQLRAWGFADVPEEYLRLP